MNQAPSEGLGEPSEQRVMRKVTRKLVPFLCLCFMSAFMDRVNVGFAKSQMMLDLRLSAAAYGFGAGVFFIGYFLFEVPSNLAMVRLGARAWIARIMVVWGLVSASMVFVHSSLGFCWLRFLLGVSEAGFFPGVILYLTHWFPSAHRSRTVALFMTAAVLSNVVGGPLSGVLLQLDGTWGIRGWKWLFVVEALPSIVLGVIVFLRLPNGPNSAAWLQPKERAWLTARLAAEGEQRLAAHDLSFLRTAADPGVLLLCLIYFSNVVGGYGLDFFLPTLMTQAFPEQSSTAIGVLCGLPALCAIPVMVLHARSSDERGERRWHVMIALGCAAFGLFLSSLPVPAAFATLALTLAVIGRWSTVAPFWGLSTQALSGRNAAGGIAMINAVGNLGGFAGPFWMGWSKDATGGYGVGLRCLAAVMFFGGVLSLLVRTGKRRKLHSVSA